MYLANNNNILSNYIKYKLKNTKFPKLTIWKEGLDIIESSYYVVDNNIVVANKTGKVTNKQLDFTFITQFKRDLLEVKDYNTFSSNSSYYDAITHFYLMESLRLERDLDDKNLMSMSNVWSGAYVGDKELKYSFNYQNGKPNVQVDILDRENKVYEIMRVDVKPNVDYSIYIESNLPVCMTAIAYDKGRKLVPLQVGNKVFPSMQYTKPVIWNFTITDAMLKESTDYAILKDYMTLLIQVPKNMKRRLVLEGNYLNNKILNNGDSVKLISQELKVNTIPSLVKFLTNEGSVLFSDTLVGYLIDFFITNTDSIDENISRVQEQINSIYFKTVFGESFNGYIDAIYSKEMQKWLSEFQSKFYKTEITGFIDSRLERLINRGVRWVDLI